jgi:hypothetical protein
MVEMVSSPSNRIEPKFTKEQIELAKKIVGEAVDVSIGQKMEGAARSYYKPSDTGGGGGEKEKEPNTDLRDTIKSAFVNPTSPKSPIDRKFMANRLTALSGGKIVVTVPTQKGVIGYMVKRADSTAPPINIQNARDISPYFFGPGEKGIYSFDEQEELARQGGQANSIEPTTKDASIDWKNLDKLVKAKGKKLEEGQAGEIGRAIKAEIKKNPKKNPYTIYKEVVDNYFSGNISSSGNNEDIKFDADGNIIM